MTNNQQFPEDTLQPNESIMNWIMGPDNNGEYYKIEETNESSLFEGVYVFKAGFENEAG